MYFHEFLDFKNPVVSNIYPIEKANSAVEQIVEKIDLEHTYFSLNKEDKDKLIQHFPDLTFQFIEPVFFEGFQYKDISVYTQKELFKEYNISLSDLQCEMFDKYFKFLIQENEFINIY